MSLISKLPALRKLQVQVHDAIQELGDVMVPETVPMDTKLSLSLVLDMLDKVEAQLERMLENN
jgi:hypothetical protein